MPINVIVGAQYGGEGKGKITSHLSRTRDIDLVVRCGGPNSGHTVFIDDERHILRQVPAGVVDPDPELAIASGALIDLDVLRSEIDLFNIDSDRLTIDPNATIVLPEYQEREAESELRDRIASTCTGTGVAVAERALRGPKVEKASDVPELEPYVGKVRTRALDIHKAGGSVIIEGTQGFGLSVYHGPHYPYVTSRDTTAAAFLSEVGLPPTGATDVTMVVRTFPIRVGGNSGPLANEITWETLRKESGYPRPIVEYTSVTKTRRRIGRFDMEIVYEASRVNAPTQIALNGTDYLDYQNFGASRYEDLTQGARNFIQRLESELGVQVKFVGVGPRDRQFFERSDWDYVE